MSYKFNNHHRVTWKEFGRRFYSPGFTCVWANEKIGCFWKRKLSKARRNQAKMELRGIRTHSIANIEGEVNYKTW